MLPGIINELYLKTNYINFILYELNNYYLNCFIDYRKNVVHEFSQVKFNIIDDQNYLTF